MRIADLNSRWQHWDPRKWGSNHERDLEFWTYSVDCSIGDRIFSFMHTYLGKIEKRRDERFTWYLMPGGTYPPQGWPIKKHTQGVVATFEEAKAIIEGVQLEQGAPPAPEPLQHLELRGDT